MTVLTATAHKFYNPLLTDWGKFCALDFVGQITEYVKNADSVKTTEL